MSDWIDRFPGLSALDPDDKSRLVAGSTTVTEPAGSVVFSPGERADTMLLLIQGTIAVQQKSESGRDVGLYRVNAGESCVLTTACMLAFDDYSAEGTAVTDITAIAIPRALFDDLVARSRGFREFVFKAFSRRITDLFSLVDAIVSKRVDVRLAERLLELEAEGVVRATHQGLATDVGSAREVVSRILADFQKRGWIDQGRGTVQLRNPDALAQMARQGG